MNLVVDNPLFCLLFDHNLETNAGFEEIGAFLIIGSPVDTMPEFCLVHANKIHDHVGEDVRNILTNVMSKGTTTALVREPHLDGVLFELVKDLGSKMLTMEFKVFVYVVSVF